MQYFFILAIAILIGKYASANFLSNCLWKNFFGARKSNLSAFFAVTGMGERSPISAGKATSVRLDCSALNINFTINMTPEWKIEEGTLSVFQDISKTFWNYSIRKQGPWIVRAKVYERKSPRKKYIGCFTSTLT